MKKGFTLIELLVCIALIGLITTIVIVAVSGYEECLESHTERVWVEQHVEQQTAYINGGMAIVPMLIPGATTTQTICDKYKEK